jgi:membrane-bound inhibitor of C-type lysozyme
MSTLVIEELKTTLTQDFTLNNDSLVGFRIKAIRPMLYLHNDPAGTFTISLKQGVTTIDSKSLTLAEILSGSGFSSGQYHWGVFKFEFDNYNKIKRNVTYTIELSASGYSFSESSYMGWVKPHEDFKNTFTGTGGTFLNNAFGYEIWGHKI